ncbi:MAG: serine/threonine-protein kinase [Candidatus Xenobia bacterium]
MLAVGELLQGRYAIERVIGQGGMGVVYLARCVALNNHPVAIKQVQVEEDDRASALLQFRQEATLLSRLNHPGLVPVVDFFEDGDQVFLVMEYVDGLTLDLRLSDDPLPPWSDVLQWAREIGEVLRYLHAQSPPIIIKDLKPGNVMLERESGRIKLIDFGLARMLIAGTRTQTYARGWGTPGYAPPEQHQMTGTDATADIYAFGATLYTLLTGFAPPGSLDLLHGHDVLNPMRVLNPAVPPALETLVMRMMALQREDRPQTVAEVLSHLQALPTAEPVPAVRPRSHRWALIAAAVLAALSLIAMLMLAARADEFNSSGVRIHYTVDGHGPRWC